MSDPLSSAVAGQPSPLAFSLASVNAAMDILRNTRDGIRGNEGGAAAGLNKLPPNVRVWIRNDTGTDLTVGSIVAIGDPLITITDTDAVHAFRDEPVFKGTTPAATTDAFAILDEPIAATTGSGSGTVYSYGRALVLGVTVCNVNMTTTFPTHSYATPTVSSTSLLTSGTSGPARILYAETGTGTKTAAVVLTGAQAAVSGSITVEEQDGSPSVGSVTTLRLDQADGFVVSTPGAGVARIDIQSASGSQAGIVDTAAQTFAGVKTFTSNVVIDTGGSATSFMFKEQNNSVAFGAGTLISDGLVLKNSADSAFTRFGCGNLEVVNDIIGQGNVYAGAWTGTGIFVCGSSTGITTTKTVKDGTGTNQTVTITGGIITGWT